MADDEEPVGCWFTVMFVLLVLGGAIALWAALTFLFFFYRYH